MKVISRTPLQILLIEQIFYPLVLLIGLVLLASYGPLVVVKALPIAADTTTYLFMGLFFVGLLATTCIWIPWSCWRLWQAATQKYDGWACYLWKLYSLLFGLTMLSLLVSIIIGMPDIMSELSRGGSNV